MKTQELQYTTASLICNKEVSVRGIRMERERRQNN